MNLAINLRTYVAGKIGGLENVVRNVCGGIAREQQRLDQPLTIFAHANTGNDLADHTQHVIWFGESEKLDLSIFS